MRDFIYMDTERIKSYVAQAEGGLPAFFEKLRGRETGVDAEAGLDAKAGTLTKLFADVGVRGDLGASLLLSRSERESFTFHDALYDRLETLLGGKNDDFIDVPQGISAGQWSQMITDGQLSPTCVLRVTGRVRVWDYRRMRDLIANFEQLGDAIVKCVEYGEMQEKEEELRKATTDKKEVEKKKVRRKAEKALDVKGIAKITEPIGTIMDCLYGTPLLLRVLPVAQDPTIRIVCWLEEQYLRDSKDAMLFKYGNAPPHPWTVLGQVAAMPPPNYAAEPLEGVFGNEVIEAFSGMFQAFGGFEDFGITVRHPEVAITPLAVYQAAKA